MVAPIYWLIVASSKNTAQLFSTSTFLPPAHLSLWSNLKSLFSYNSGDFKWWFLNSLIYAIATAALATAVSTLCGYGLAKYRFRGRGAIFGLVVGALMVPGTALVVPLFLLEHDMHLTNSYQGVILPLMVYPFGVYFMSIFAAEAVPDTLVDSCRIDGARGVAHLLENRPADTHAGHGDAVPLWRSSGPGTTTSSRWSSSALRRASRLRSAWGRGPATSTWPAPANRFTLR